MASYYEELCKKKGIKIPSHIMIVRNADKNQIEKYRVIARKERAAN